MKNQRSIKASIESFRIEALIRTNSLVSSAETGDIRELQRTGKKLKNLAAALPLHIDQVGSTGYLQFPFKGLGPTGHDIIGFKLIMTDQSGERHFIEGLKPSHE